MIITLDLPNGFAARVWQNIDRLYDIAPGYDSVAVTLKNSIDVLTILGKALDRTRAQEIKDDTRAANQEGQ